MVLGQIVADLADSFMQADALAPVATSQRGDRTYQPGIGPHAENQAVRLALDQLERMPRYSDVELGQFLAYPDAPRLKCDLWIGDPVMWAIEVKMARFAGDNGKPDPGALKDVLSPYPVDRSAVTDCAKLAESGLTCAKAIVIYGFETSERPLAVVIEAFERLVSDQVELGQRHEAAFGPLVHPVHRDGWVFGWEVAAAG